MADNARLGVPTTKVAVRRPLAESALISSGAQPARTTHVWKVCQFSHVRAGGHSAKGLRTATLVVGTQGSTGARTSERPINAGIASRSTNKNGF